MLDSRNDNLLIKLINNGLVLPPQVAVLILNNQQSDTITLSATQYLIKFYHGSIIISATVSSFGPGLSAYLKHTTRSAGSAPETVSCPHLPVLFTGSVFTFTGAKMPCLIVTSTTSA
jgi:hypothetical protein